MLGFVFLFFKIDFSFDNIKLSNKFKWNSINIDIIKVNKTAQIYTILISFKEISNKIFILNYKIIIL